MPRCKHHWLPVPEPHLPVCMHCGRTPTASPSQLETWRGCRRKWAYSRVRPRTENRPAQYGQRCHDICEAWGKHGHVPDPATAEGMTVLTVLEYLPPPRTALHELRVTPIMAGIPWDMRLDWIDGYAPGRYVAIGDLKTTSKWDYAKTGEYLSTQDAQGTVYGHWAAQAFNVPLVVGRWVYGLRKKNPPKGRSVGWMATRDDLARRYHEEIAPEAREMCRSRPLPPEELPRTLSHCEAFGGCPFRPECHATLDPAEQAAHALVQIRGAA